MNPSLRLTRELVDQIVFGMENQDREYVLDTHEGKVVPADHAAADDTGDRYVELPEWRSVDGYNLMEQFVATLHNPIYRSRLRSILASGRGVFRQFKDTVRERREIERMWFNFKEKAMRDLVADWYNDLREREGLDRLELQSTETETDQLIELDFVFRSAIEGELPTIAELDREAFDEIFDDSDDDTVDLYYRASREGIPAVSHAASTVLVTETQGGEFAGFLWAITRRSGEASAAYVVQLYILPEFRGFGLARETLRTYCRSAHEQRIDEVHLSLAGSALDFEASFTGYGMTRRSVELAIDVDRWYRSQTG